MKAKKGLIFGLSMAVLTAGLFLIVNSASADSVSYSSSSASASASASASSSSSARVGSIHVSVDHENHGDHDANHKKSARRLPATGSDMLIMLGLAAFSSLVVYVGSKSVAKAK